MSASGPFLAPGKNPSHTSGLHAGPAKLLRLLLVDDHAIVRDGLRAVLDASGICECFEAGSAEEAISLIRTGAHPQIAVIDFSLPGMDGLDTIPELLKLLPDLRILLLSMQPEEELAARALRLGAYGYVSKGSSSAAIVEAVRTVAAGEKYISRQFAAKLAMQLVNPAPRPAHETLSDREFETLRLLASGKSVSEIADVLSLSVKTISTYRQRLLEKLSLENNYEIIRYALEHGLVDAR